MKSLALVSILASIEAVTETGFFAGWIFHGSLGVAICDYHRFKSKEAHPPATRTSSTQSVSDCVSDKEIDVRENSSN